MNSPLPQWLCQEDKDQQSSEGSQTVTTVAEGKKAKRDLNLLAYEAIFERALDDISAGQPLTYTIECDHRDIEYQRFLAWIHKDESRKARYYEAQAVGAEVVAAQMIEIADADDSLEDVARSTLRINTRKWLLGVWNRKRFGDVKQQDVNINVNLGDAMREARARIDARTIDVSAKVINE